MQILGVHATDESVHWQAWLEDGPVPLVSKALIDLKTEPGSPKLDGLAVPGRARTLLIA